MKRAVAVRGMFAVPTAHLWEHCSSAGVVDRIEVDRDFDGTPDGTPAP